MSHFNKKLFPCLCTSLISLPWAFSPCFALPSRPVAEFGSVDVEYPNPQTMIIKPSDGAILHYKNFEIGPNEEVHFLQKSALHQITGKHSSQILGSIQSSGDVILVNTKGIEFGAKSKVDVGSLIASTLDISKKDFLKKSYQFYQEKAVHSSIVVKGLISASNGPLVILAPHIQNLGSLTSKLVFLGAGEQATFDGSNLSLQGCQKDALIEQLGMITATDLWIKMPLSKKSIPNKNKSHLFLKEKWGMITIGADSQIQADQFFVEGSNVSMQSSIDATNSLNMEEVDLHGVPPNSTITGNYNVDYANFGNGCTFKGNLTATDYITFGEGCSISGNLSAGNSIQVNGSLTLLGTTSLSNAKKIAIDGNLSSVFTHLIGMGQP